MNRHLHLNDVMTDNTSSFEWVTVLNAGVNNHTTENETDVMIELEQLSSPLDCFSVKVILIVLYTLVFIVCFIGNIFVILVITLHRQMRTITNFFLANLSVADLCVGIFCIMPNLSTYLSSAQWMFGQAMCKFYYFIQATCYTASVCILTVISVERYIAIIYPIHTRRLHSMSLLRATVTLVWTIAIASGLPYLYFYNIFEVEIPNAAKLHYCIIVGDFNRPVFNVVSLVLWYIIPLCMMSFVYTRISVVLWQSNQLSSTGNRSLQPRRRSSNEASRVRIEETADTQPFRSRDVQVAPSQAVTRNSSKTLLAANARGQSTSSDNVMTSRRRVIRLLITVMLSFAACVFPYHIRQVWYAFNDPDPGSYWQTMLLPSTFIVYYLNSALNPLLYAFLSDKFRTCLLDLVVKCRGKDNRYGNGTAGRLATGQQQALLLKTFNVNSTAKLTVVE